MGWQLKRLAKRLCFDRALHRVLILWPGRRRFRIVMVEELPDRLEKNKLYAIGAGTPWLAALRCPCGCDDIIQLSLLEYESPSWSLRLEKDGAPTLVPSVWRSQGCKSHFFLRQGVILWCDSKRGAFPAKSKRRRSRD
ncbi:MAG TPA: DUF6527 family protein [Candidatus Sulfotelmatobacter sp.]|nr:DUF6527 family protein [Candidatus Sulfotelmatobacter sp.]